MSPPTKQLGKLSIGETMPTTRSEAQRRATVERDTDSEDESSSEEEEGPSPTTSLRGASNIAYNTHDLSSISRSRANAGIQGEFLVEQCRAVNEDYEFQIRERGRVRIARRGPSCTCSEFSEGQACKHIYWLLDRIYPSIRPIPASLGPITLHDDGTSTLGSIYRDIDLEKIAQNQDWTYVPVGGTALDSYSETGSGMSRKQTARDILSAFEGGTLPDDFRPDIYDNLPETRQDPQSCVEQLDLQGTILRLAVSDEGVYESLRNSMPAGARANIFFEKLRQKPRDLLRTLDEYAQSGPRGPDGIPVEIGAIAEGLRAYIREVQSSIELRAPHGHKYAAQPIVGLFEDICLNRNRDIFEHVTWARLEPLGEETEDRNLFHHLMVASTEFGNLVLQILDDFPIEILSSFRARLDTIRDKLVFTDATRAYSRRLAEILRQLDAGAEPSSVSAPPPRRHTRRTSALEATEQSPVDTQAGSGAFGATGGGAPTPSAPSGQKRRAEGAPRGGKKRPR